MAVCWMKLSTCLLVAIQQQVKEAIDEKEEDMRKSQGKPHHNISDVSSVCVGNDPLLEA